MFPSLRKDLYFFKRDWKRKDYHLLLSVFIPDFSSDKQHQEQEDKVSLLRVWCHLVSCQGAGLVCVRDSEWAECVCVCVRVCACVRACVRARARVCVCVCVFKSFSSLFCTCVSSMSVC